MKDKIKEFDEKYPDIKSGINNYDTFREIRGFIHQALEETRNETIDEVKEFLENYFTNIEEYLPPTIKDELNKLKI